MNRVYISVFLLFSTLIISGHVNAKTLTEDNLYFGEKRPGLVPKLFDPKLVSPDGRFDHGSFSPDMKEFYFTRKHGKYKKRAHFVIRYENNRWGPETETDIKWPQFSPDGNIMYTGKKYRKRTNTGWSKPKSPGDFIEKMAHGMSVSDNGTYYITVYKKGDFSENGTIHYSRLIDGKYAPSVKINVGINSAKYVGGSTIANDESYLIWYMERKDGYGQSDLYVSFQQKDGSWLPAINMGSKINTEMQESAPQLTHDGKFLFFTRGGWKSKEDGSRYYVGKRYWVSTEVIENLRPKL